MSQKVQDLLGRKFVVGDKVARAITGGRAINLAISEVTRIENGRMYLDNSKVAVIFPGRMLIVTPIIEGNENET